MIILTKRIYEESDIVLKAIMSLYGEFKNNFIQIYGKTASEVREEIEKHLFEMGRGDIHIDIYVYISSFDEDGNITVIIRKVLR